MMLLVGLLLVLPEFADPYVQDEGFFIENIRFFTTNGYLKGAHPPAYTLYLLLISNGFDSMSPIILRASTFLFTCLTVVVVYVTCKLIAIEIHMVDDNSAIKISALAVFLFFMSPIAVQTGVLIDMENLFVFLIALIFFWFVAAYELYEVSPVTKYGITGLLVCAISWNKFGPLPAITGAFVGYFLLRHQIREALRFCAATAGGFLLFLLSWGLLAITTETSFVTPFATDSRFINDVATLPLSIIVGRGVEVFLFELLWISPFIVGLALLAVTSVIRQVNIPPYQSHISVIHSKAILLPFVLFSLLTVIEYTVLLKGDTYAFSKYVARTIPVLVVPAAFAVAPYITGKYRKLQRYLILSSIAVSACMFIIIAIVGDPFVGMKGDVIERYLMYIVVTSIGFVATWLTLYYADIDFSRRSLLTLTLVVTLVGANFALVTTQATSSHQTRYYYGTEGTTEALTYADEQLDCNPGARIGAPRGLSNHLAVVSGYEWQEQVFTTSSVEDLRRQNVSVVIVRTTADHFNTPERVSSLSEYTKAAQFNHYYVFRQKSYNTCQ